MSLTVVASLLLSATLAFGSTRAAGLPAALAQANLLQAGEEAGLPTAAEPGYATRLYGPDPIVEPRRVHPGANLQIDDFYVHIPAGAVEPLVPVLVLHGVGGGGQEFSEVVRARCDAEHWVLIAPTFGYGNWLDPNVLARESTQHFPRINAFLDRLPAITGMSVQPRVHMYGFSRGAQAANRYALAYPERVAGVAMMAAGTYTLPIVAQNHPTTGELAPALFPFGVANLQDLFGRGFDAREFGRIPFWVGVGERDNDPTEVPRQWDPYLGRDRVERAQRFTTALRRDGLQAELRVFPGVGHGVPIEVNAAAMDFIAAHD